MDSYSSENDLEQFPVELAVVGITLSSNGVMFSCPDSVESHSCGDELDMSGLQPDDPALTRTCTHGVKPFNVSLAHAEFEHPAFSMILLDPMSAAIASYNTKSAVPGRRLCEDFELKLKPTANYHLVFVLAHLASGIERYPELGYLSFECGATHRLGIILDVTVGLTHGEAEVQHTTPAELFAHCQASCRRLLQHQDLKTLVDHTGLDVSFPTTDMAEEYYVPPLARQPEAWEPDPHAQFAHSKALHKRLRALQLKLFFQFWRRR